MNLALLDRAGASTLSQLEYVGDLVIQSGKTVRALGRAFPLIGNRNRWLSAIRQMFAIGVGAIPMVSIMAICTGFIFAMQGASELRRFGAIQLVTDLVTIGFTRELGPLLTAIAVSGRSGSAFSAEIGTMVVTEEIDALRTMAIDPIEFVLVPKFLAALIMMPCLTILSDASGIFAGGVFLRLATGTPFNLYLIAVAHSVVLRDVISGLVKSLAFAVVIVHVGCLEGFRVRGGPDAVGRSATSAVVKATFLVILVDVGFTALFYLTGAH